MPRFDLTSEELRAYRPSVSEPADFDSFWRTTLEDSRARAEPPRLVPVKTPLTEFDTFDVTFSGYGGDPVRGWFIVPAGATHALPTVLEFNGYGGGRGLPHERLAWAAAGYAYFFMDTRGQGSSHGSGGDTPDPHGAGPAAPGFMTRGIEDPRTYYYRRIYTDAVLAVDAVRTFDRVDSSRLAVCGASQGGGIAMAAAGLASGLIAAMPDVPFLCNFERAVGMTDRLPYGELVRYLAVHRDSAQRVFETLSYFDGVNFAKRATQRALFSVGLLDPVCPPSTVYAAHNHWGSQSTGAASPAEIVDYPFNEHEGGGGEHWVRQAIWLQALLRDLDDREVHRNDARPTAATGSPVVVA